MVAATALLREGGGVVERQVVREKTLVQIIVLKQRYHCRDTLACAEHVADRQCALRHVHQTPGGEQKELLDLLRNRFLGMTRAIHIHGSLDLVVAKLKAFDEKHHRVLLLQRAEDQRALLHGIALQLSQCGDAQRDLEFRVTRISYHGVPQEGEGAGEVAGDHNGFDVRQSPATALRAIQRAHFGFIVHTCDLHTQLEGVLRVFL